MPNISARDYLKKGFYNHSIEKKFHQELDAPVPPRKIDFTSSLSSNSSTWFQKKIQQMSLRIALPAAIIYPKNTLSLNTLRRKSARMLKKGHIFKRFTIKTADGAKIDVLAICPKGKKLSKRWTVFSNPNAGCYEKLINKKHHLLTATRKLKSNLLLYNYRGVGASQGTPTAKGLVNDSAAVLQFAQNKKRGLGAKEIIEWGHSIGGGVNGQLFKEKLFKPKVPYVSINDRSFSSTSQVFETWTGAACLGRMNRQVGWDFDAFGGALKRKHPQIILRHKNDPLIPDKASLAKAVQNNARLKKKKSIKVITFTKAPKKASSNVHMRSYHKKEVRIICHQIKKALRNQ